MDRYRIGLSWLFPVLLLSLGCGSAVEALPEVTGRVVIKSLGGKEQRDEKGRLIVEVGAPPEAAKVTFYRGSAPVAIGFTDPQGFFRIKTGVDLKQPQTDGLAPGDYKITILNLKPKKEGETEATTPAKPGETKPPAPVRVPNKYGRIETTDLAAKVEKPKIVIPEEDRKPTDPVYNFFLLELDAAADKPVGPKK